MPPRRPSTAARAALLLLCAAAPATAAPAFTKSTLPNGLTLIVHEDHTLPVCAVNVLYRVGSRDEQKGRTGFAHLFEHLMFMGTERAPVKMFDRWLEAGGGENNAWTGNDATDYHETAPASALPLMLWLEADRLGTLGRSIDKPKLDLQRDVVRNERRQSIENVPYGKVELRLPELLYPDGHPYHHPVIGSHADLEAASVEDVRSFFATYYVPANASLAVAGDVTTADVQALATRYFGGISAGRRPARAATDARGTPNVRGFSKPGVLPIAPPKLERVVRETLEDQVELPKLIVAFHSPALFEPGDAELDLLADELATGKAARLYKALVYDKPLAQAVTAQQNSQDLSSFFSVEVLARPGVSLDEIENVVDRVLTDAATRPPAADELTRGKNGHEFHFLERLQSPDAWAAQLNLYDVKTGDPGYFDKDLARYRDATADGVLRWAKSTLTLDRRVVLRVVPSANKGGESGGAQ